MRPLADHHCPARILGVDNPWTKVRDVDTGVSGMTVVMLACRSVRGWRVDSAVVVQERVSGHFLRNEKP